MHASTFFPRGCKNFKRQQKSINKQQQKCKQTAEKLYKQLQVQTNSWMLTKTDEKALARKGKEAENYIQKLSKYFSSVAYLNAPQHLFFRMVTYRLEMTPRVLVLP